MSFADFDKYVLDNNIQPDDVGAAFGAWMNLETGWDGDQDKVKEPENSQEWQEHDLLLPFGEVGTYIALVNKQDDDFTTIDNSTVDRVIKAGCSDQMTIYLLLHQRSYTDPKTGKLVATPTTHAWLVKKTGFSLSTVKTHIKRLNDAQLINCYSTRQMTELGNSTQDGNCYGINYRRYTGDETIKVKDSIIKQYSEQVIILTGRNNDLTEQVAYWTNLYRELKNAEGETK